MTKPNESSWSLDYYGYEPGTKEYSTETMLTVGNGYIGLRGTVPEMRISDDHYPATYIAGLYNETFSKVSDREIPNEDFVNAQNLQYLSVTVDGNEINFSKDRLSELARHLDMRTGLLSSKAVFNFPSDKKVEIRTKKFASMCNRNQYAISYDVTPLNFSGEIKIISEADGDVYNYNVERYRSLNMHHLKTDELKATEGEARLVSNTSNSNLTVIQESKLLSKHDLIWENTFKEKKIIQEAVVDLKENESLTVEKLVFVYKASDKVNEFEIEDISGLSELTDFDDMFEKSKRIWEELWEQADIQTKGDMMSEKLLHLHTYHLLVSCSPSTVKGLDVSVTARGLHGEAYRGHIFWDELFILPFYILHFPETAKELLMYRYNRLDEAKKAAKDEGFKGAMYPWQSGLDGREQTQVIHLNPMSGKWDPDNSRLQRHVSHAIAYNIWLYYVNTDDTSFMEEYGLEMLLEICKFWISMAKLDKKAKRYSIEGVMGPDEFHEAYPDSDKGGLNNNAYTNMMTAWLFGAVKDMFDELPADAVKSVREKVGFDVTYSEKLKDMMGKLSIEINDEGIISQFDGYFDLDEINLEEYKEKYGDIQRMDRILKAEGKSPDRFKVAKQADSLMTFYNLDKKKIDRLLSQLKYDMPDDYFTKNLNYYLKRTSHGSTLSRVVHTKLAAMAGEKDLSAELYKESLYSDYEDIQGGTTAEGIHAGVMAATIYIALNTYGGIDIREDILKIDPAIPRNWKELRFKLYKKGIHFIVDITENSLKIKADKEVEVVIKGEKIKLNGGEETEISF